MKKRQTGKYLNSHNGWIFGKRGDFVAFTFPLVLAFFILWLDRSVPLDQFHIYPLVLIIDAAHVYSTFTYTYASPEEWRRNRRWFIIIPLFLFVLNVAMLSYDPAFFWIFFATWSIYHFLKQSQAWFYVSAGLGASRDPLTIKIDKAAIYAATFGLTLCSLCGPVSKGWYSSSDLLQLPEYMFTPLLVASVILASLYPLRHLYLWFKGEKQNWAAHHIFLVTAILWGVTRLTDNDKWALITVICHAIPYFYLGYRYTSHKVRKEQYSFIYPKMSVQLLLGTMLALSLMGAITEFVGRYSSWIRNDHLILFQGLAVLFNTISLTHYTFDMFTWNRKHNPEWVLALGERK